MFIYLLFIFTPGICPNYVSYIVSYHVNYPLYKIMHIIR